MALAIPAVGMSAAHAQQQAQQKQNSQLEEVTVTGSRIVRKDYSANSPIQTINKNSLQSQTSIGLETALNQLPQFVPAATSLTQLQNQANLTDNDPTITAGASTISLRGLGTNRNLVLIDGFRAVPVNGTMAVDINSIPSAAIQRVETITGGASSVYGADAVAGVVNFITRKDFQGVNIDAQYGAMQNGGAPEGHISILFGVNSPDNKGNVMIGIERSKRQAVLGQDTAFYSHSFADPTTQGTAFFVSDPYYSIDASNPPTRAAIDGIFNQAPPNTVACCGAGGIAAGNIYWNNDGTLYTGGTGFGNGSPGAAAGLYRYTGPLNITEGNANLPGNYPLRKIDSRGLLQEQMPYFQANVPLDRTSIYGRAQYNLTPHIQAYTQFIAATSDTERLTLTSPALGGWGVHVPHGTGIYAPSLMADGVTTDPAYMAGGRFGLTCNPTGGCTNSQVWPVSPELNQLLNSRTDPNADFSFNYNLDFVNWGHPNYERSIMSATRSQQLNFGLTGDMPGIDGTWTFVASKGVSKMDAHLSGMASLTRVRTLFLSPNWGKGFFAQGNAGIYGGGQGGGFSGGVATCTSGMPVFTNHANVSQDCLDTIFLTSQEQSEMDQNFVELDFQGHLANLPGGEARFSAGATTRSNDYGYFFDSMQGDAAFNDNLMQTNLGNNSFGSTSVKEVYGEMLVPLVKDKPGAQHMNLELGYRHSNYKIQGGVNTWKALLDWGITKGLRFRGGKQRATRAPNIAEMFQAATQNWYASGTADPCAAVGNATYGADPNANPTGYQQARSLCSTIMGPVAADYFYNPANPQPSPFFSLPFYSVTGNPNVNPETASTLTAGFVWQPQSGHDKLDALNLTVDYYSIDISDMISIQPVEVVYEACLSAASNPTASATTPACLAIARNPTTGGEAPTTVTYVNAAFAKVDGVDFTANWHTNLAKGTFGINFMVTDLLKEDTQATASAPVLHWKGSLGPTPGTSLTAGAFDYRTFTTFNYGRNDWNLAMRWRHLPSAIDPTAVVSAFSTHTGAQQSYDVFDLTGSWNATDKTTMRFGITNLLDTPPVWTGGRTAADAYPTDGSDQTEAGFYDILGRQYYVGVNVNF